MDGSETQETDIAMTCFQWIHASAVRGSIAPAKIRWQQQQRKIRVTDMYRVVASRRH